MIHPSRFGPIWVRPGGGTKVVQLRILDLSQDVGDLELPHDHLPDYEPMLEAYHQAFAAELRSMIETLPIGDGQLVLEMACGDGFYTPWLAQLVGPSGRVVALDHSLSYLEVAKAGCSDRSPHKTIDYVAGSIDRIPFADRTFDAVWCAQSLFSLPEPLAAVTWMAEVVKPGGLVSILEDDRLHQVLLPWPVDVELAVRQAEWAKLQDESPHPSKFYVGRRLVGLLREAGLVDIEIRSFASSKIAPLSESAQKFLEEYLYELRNRVEHRLSSEIRERFLHLTDPDSPDALINQSDLSFTMIDHIVRGRRA